MRVLLLTHGTYLHRDAIVSGNSVRAYYLSRGLVEHGIEVIYVYPEGLDSYARKQAADVHPGITIQTYRNPEDLAGLLVATRPDAIYVGYWELLEHIPIECDLPIILDVLAPRVLETRFQGVSLQSEVQRMLALYRRADRFVCGNELQRSFLVPWLILAGIDCYREVPIDVIPISSEPGCPHHGISIDHQWRLVNGGVSWPWRQSGTYREAILQTLRSQNGVHGRLIEISGGYIYEPGATGAKTVQEGSKLDADIVETMPLLSYREMERFFSGGCDIGLELSERNVEREFSQSFRSIEYLRCGLPVICNDYLDLARRIRDFDAGWIVAQPQDIPDLLRDISSHPEEYRAKSENAIRLVEECFHYKKSINPLLRYLAQPKRPARGKALGVVNEKGDDRAGGGYALWGLARSFAVARLRGLRHLFCAVVEKTKRFWQLLRLPAEPCVVRPPENIGRRAIRWAGGLFRRFYALVIKPLVVGRQGRHIAIVTRKDLFPTNHGAAVKIERSAWGESFCVDSVFVITGDWTHYYVFEQGVKCKVYYPWVFRFCALFTYRAMRKLQKLGVPTNDAFLYHALFDWGYFLRLIYLAYRFRIVLYQAEFPGYLNPCLWASRIFSGKTMLVEHNVEFKRIKEQYPDISDQAYEFVRNVEIDLARRADLVVTVSQLDREELVANGVSSEKIYYVPHGVDLELYRKDYDFDLRGKYEIEPGIPILVYHGIYCYPPNLEAIQILANEILPRLALRGYRVKVIAIGRDQPPETLHEDVIFTGPVDNLAPYLKGSDLAVVPLQKGGGTRMKILEYFAAGVPVVATSKAVEGMPIENRVHAWIEDDFDRFADAIVELLRNRDCRESLTAAGQQFVEALDWRNIAQRYINLAMG